MLLLTASRATPMRILWHLIGLAVAINWYGFMGYLICECVRVRACHRETDWESVIWIRDVWRARVCCCACMHDKDLCNSEIINQKWGKRKRSETRRRSGRLRARGTNTVSGYTNTSHTRTHTPEHSKQLRLMVNIWRRSSPSTSWLAAPQLVEPPSYFTHAAV